MSETYPRKTHCETLFAGHISLQRRNRLQRYYKICRCARKIAFWCDFYSVRCKSTPTKSQTLSGTPLVYGVKAGKILGELTPNTELICGVGKNEIFGIFLQKKLEIQGFIIIFVITFGKMHCQNCSLLQKIKQNYLSANKVISDFLRKKPKISLTKLQRLIIRECNKTAFCMLLH